MTTIEEPTADDSYPIIEHTKKETKTKQKEPQTFRCLRCSYKTTIKANFIRHTNRKYPCTYNMKAECSNPIEIVEPSEFDNWLVQFISDGNEKNNVNINEFVKNKFHNELSQTKDPMISNLIEEIKVIVHSLENKIHYLKALCLIAQKFTELEQSDETRYSMVYTLRNTIEINQVVNAFYEQLNM